MNRPWWPSGLSCCSNLSRVAAEETGLNPARGCLAWTSWPCQAKSLLVLCAHSFSLLLPYFFLINAFNQCSLSVSLFIYKLPVGASLWSINWPGLSHSLRKAVPHIAKVKSEAQDGGQDGPIKKSPDGTLICRYLPGRGTGRFSAWLNSF